LARIEAAIALRTLLDGFPALRVAEGGVRWRALTTLRGLEKLELETEVEA
jgi:cytochrome P450